MLSFELGYRYYGGEMGANGFFFGTSFLYYTYRDGTYGWHEDGSLYDYYSKKSMGLALDIGGQHIFGNGITIGAGGGVALLPSAGNFFGEGWFWSIMPRVLFTLGYSF